MNILVSFYSFVAHASSCLKATHSCVKAQPPAHPDARAVLRDSRHPCTQNHNIQAAKPQDRRRTVQNNSATPPYHSAAAKCDNAPQNLHAPCVLCGALIN